MISRLLRAVIPCAVLAVEPAAWANEHLEFFEKRIRPLLVTKCHSCHSTKAKPKFAGLELDSRPGLMRGSDSGPVVLPGNPSESKLIRAVRGQLPVTMPPNGKLSETEQADLARWVEIGAPWPEQGAGAAQPVTTAFDLERRRQEHWAWQPVRKPAPPEVKDHAWSLTVPDRFLRAAMDQKGLRPSVEADRRTLIRRITFDLTGLPPTPAEIAAFERDNAPGAYHRVVDRLLSSPRFGELWARHWMDLIRYSESHGSEGDPDTPLAWRYRDYLIRAFNDDLPYDQLLREHIAGDLLPHPRRNERERINESTLGVAHFRMVEHGFQPVDPWEDRIKWVDNQVDVFTKAFQGLTVSCARCHDHKFDAISQRDYYALFGILRSTRPVQVAVDVREDLERNRTALLNLKPRIREALAAAWLEELPKLAARLADQDVLLSLEEESCNAEGALAPWFQLRGSAPAKFAKGWRDWATRWTKEIETRRKFNTANFRSAWNLASGDYGSWVTHGSGVPAKPSTAGEFSVLPHGAKAISGIYPAGVYSHLASAKNNAVIASPRFRIDTNGISLRLLGGNVSFAQLIIENYAVPRGGIYNLRFSPKKDEMGWVRWDTRFWKGFTAYIEFATKDDVTHFQLDVEDARNKRQPSADGRSYFGAQAVWFHDDHTITPKEELPAFQALLAASAPASEDELIERYRGLLAQAIRAWQENGLDDQQTALLDYFVRHGILTNSADRAQTRELIAEYRRLEAEIPLPRRAPGLLEEGGEDQKLLVRGNHKNFGEAVPRRYLTALGGARYENPREMRLRLADEVASASNPLTARVMVNRIWRLLFGSGLVRTVDNFGKLGEKPSHAELLDWLATRFVEDGWSIKKMVALLVRTRAYRASSDPMADSSADPSNRLLSRMPVKRLEAEAIRDAILQVSGQLDPAMYGPSVDTYYLHDTGKTKGDKPKGPLDGNRRRSVYLEVRRNVTNPFLEVFDAPKPASTRGERDQTNVPAQSLAMMNSPFVIEQAAKWAARVVLDGSLNPGTRVERMFEEALGRLPTSAERDQSESLVAAFAAERGVPAGQLLADPRPWSDLAHAIFNLKEFIYVR